MESSRKKKRRQRRWLPPWGARANNFAIVSFHEEAAIGFV